MNKLTINIQKSCYIIINNINRLHIILIIIFILIITNLIEQNTIHFYKCIFMLNLTVKLNYKNA